MLAKIDMTKFFLIWYQRRMKKFYAVFIFFFQALVALETDVSEIQIDIGYAAGKYITIEDYAILSAFTPIPLNDPYSTFFDVRTFRFNDGKWALSTGVGLRYELCNGDIFGVNAYYDYRRGKSRGNFSQLGLGAEWLDCLWEARINGYFPQKRGHRGSCHKFDLGDGFFMVNTRPEHAYTGFDAEVGLHLFCVSNCI